MINTNPSTNIIDQIASYNSTNLENLIYNLSRELKEQKDINQLLKTDDDEGNIKKIKDFIAINEGQINDQSDRLDKVILDLKNTINENKRLEQIEDKYEEVLKSEEANRVAEKLRDIKKMKENINIFLADRGIIIPQQ